MEKKYYIPDLETGYKHEVSKETWEAFMRAWDNIRPKLDDKYTGKVLIFGTGGDRGDMDRLKNLFYNSKQQTMHIQIWAEGYRATGEGGGAQLMWQGEAKDFDDAILIYENESKTVVDRYEGVQATRSKYGIWACRLFDNEVDARKSFG